MKYKLFLLSVMTLPVFAYAKYVPMLSAGSQKLLNENGFVILPTSEKDIFDIYDTANESGAPPFVTSDLALHSFHMLYDYSLRFIELNYLLPTLDSLIDIMIKNSLTQIQFTRDNEQKELSRLNLAYFIVAKKLLHPEYAVSDQQVEKLVNEEIALIQNHEGFAPRPLLTYIENPDIDVTPYAYEDYSQYVPRGHYTRNDDFRRYFLSMMWLGRIKFFFKPRGYGGDTMMYNEHGRKMATQAIFICEALERDENARRLWHKIYDITSFCVNETDDIFYKDIASVIGEGNSKNILSSIKSNPKEYNEFLLNIAKIRSPKILSGRSSYWDSTKSIYLLGFCFMGQRFIPDSYIFQNLVVHSENGKPVLLFEGEGKPFTWGKIPGYGECRVFPRGLDVMAVLGSPDALAVIEKEGDADYTKYVSILGQLKHFFENMTHDEWTKNIYYQWFYAIRLAMLEETAGKGLPSFLPKTVWRIKRLLTALGSWTQLRHDTILYAKQSYTPALKSAAPFKQTEQLMGFVEPLPQLYRHLANSLRSLQERLIVNDISTEPLRKNFATFIDVMLQLEELSLAELGGKMLSDRDFRIIETAPIRLKSATRLSQDIMKQIASEETDTRMECIADVHTNPQTGQVLEEGVGKPYKIIVLVDDINGARHCVGATFSYYEFKQPMNDRLTDEKWQDMFDKNKNPTNPVWINQILGH